jgi:hypothetical protein
MSNDISLPILATEDHSGIRDDIIYFFQKHFGLTVVAFDKNESAWDSVEKNGDRFCAAIIDYHTESQMKGAELIVRLANHGGCGEILALSSSADRAVIAGDIRTQSQQLQESEEILDQESFGRRISRVEIFDKTQEAELAELFIAAKVLFPDETNELTRKDLVSFILGEPVESDYLGRERCERYLTNLEELYTSITESLESTINRQNLLNFIQDVSRRTAEGQSRSGPERQVI